MTDRVGQQLGNYRLISLLGRGSFAEVYLGEHVYLETQAAIKVLHTQLANADIEPFRLEAKRLAHLEHPHIVRVLEFGVEGSTPFVVMSYAPGGTLRKLHPEGSRLPLSTVVSYVKQVAEALQCAHDQQLIHRDIKPENLLVGRGNQIVLSDFGIALLAQNSHYYTTLAMAGSIAYMAPEQLQDRPRPASDQYALGVVVYEWLCGERPFSGLAAEIAGKHRLVPPPSLSERVATIPYIVEQVVEKALAKDPSERFATVLAFASALERASWEGASGGTIPALASEHLGDVQKRSSNALHPHNLPVQPTSLIGREKEVTTVQQLLRREDVRLLTLTGPGGIGKTRLGLQVGAELSDRFADGVFFVNLAPLSDPTWVMPTLAQTLELKERGDQPLLDLLKVSLRDRQLLLLLDNFEQVISAASQVADLLAACPKLKVMVTSRAVLHVRGEQEFAVPPLAVPDSKHLPDLEALSQYEAVALFISRAQAIKPEFQVSIVNARAVAEICARLDGLPLAIELAAARIKLLPPQALLARLKHRLQVLTSRTQDAPTRQQTLRNTIQWSYDLLNAQEQRLFRRLSVFAGGSTLEAVEAICRTLGDEAEEDLDRIASLIDKSLLQQTEQENEDPRFDMLETIREYGLEVLDASGEMGVTRRAHAAYYLALAEEAEQHLGGPQQTVWLERLEREHDNLRAVMQWLLERAGDNEVRHGAESREMALRLGGALQRFWQVHGHWSEGRIFLERALTTSEGVVAPVLAKALKGAAWLAVSQGDHYQAEVLAQKGLTISRERGGPHDALFFLDTLGSATMVRGNFTAARPLAEEALEFSRKLGDKDGIARELILLARLLSRQGEFARARVLLEESLTLTREPRNEKRLASALFWLADTLLASQNDQATVRLPLEESLALYRKLGDKDGIGSCLHLLGQLALYQGDTATASSLAEESVVLFRELGNRQDLAWGLSFLASVVAAQGNYTAAQAFYEESLALRREVGHKGDIASGLEGLAHVLMMQGQYTWAVQLWGAAEVLREAIGSPLPPIESAGYERDVASARAHLGKKAFAAAWAEGRTMSPEQALAAHGWEMTPKIGPAGQLTNPPAKSRPTYPDGLTAREVEVLRLVAQGLTDTQVAEQLVLSRRTVNSYLTSIYSKIQVSSRSAATRYAIEHRLA